MQRTAVATCYGFFDHPVTDLHLVERPGSVTGTFEHRGTLIRFELASDADVRSARLRDANGQPLIESTLSGGIETTTYLGRLTIFGRPCEIEPRVVGDKTAMAELARRLEAAAFQPLREALENHGIARELYAAPPMSDTAKLRPGESVVIPTWSWWWSVVVELSSKAPARYQVQDGAHSWADTVDGRRRARGSWSSWTVKVTNLYSSDLLHVDAVISSKK